MDKKRFNNKGLSLVEVVMAALLLTVVLAALFASYQNANNLISLSRSKLLALTWAQTLIENERADFQGAYVSPINPAAEALTLEKTPIPGVDPATGINFGGNFFVISRVNRGLAFQEVKVAIGWIE